MSKVNQDVQDLADKIKTGVQIDVKDGQAVATIDDKLFVANLPETVPVETAKAYEQYRSTFLPAATKAFGEAGLSVLEKHKKIDSVTGSFQLLGKDTFETNLGRSATYPVPGNSDAAPITKFGVVTTKLTTYDARQKVGQLKAVIDEIGASALEAFGK